MVKVEVIERFTLKDFKALKNIERKGVEKEGELFVGDTFECDENMVNYLTGDNKLGQAFVKVIEVKPEIKEEPKEETIEEPKEKPKTTKKTKKTKK